MICDTLQTVATGFHARVSSNWKAVALNRNEISSTESGFTDN
jgi:hypothetical protein